MAASILAIAACSVPEGAAQSAPAATATGTAATAAQGCSTSAQAGPDFLDDTFSSPELGRACQDALPPPVTSAAQPATGLGAAGSSCELPVTFELPGSWQPKVIDLDVDDELEGLFRSGPFTAVCEVDARPAGIFGFIRVFTAPGTKGTPRQHLETFVASESPGARKAVHHEIRGAQYTEIELGGAPASEVRYETYNTTLEHSRTVMAFALDTPRGAVVVTVGGWDVSDHEQLVPAYDLAKRTLTVRP